MTSASAFNTIGILAVPDAGEISEAEQNAAAAVIARYARDVQDLQMLLEACGLAPYKRGNATTYSYGRVNQA